MTSEINFVISSSGEAENPLFYLFRVTSIYMYVEVYL